MKRLSVLNKVAGGEMTLKDFWKSVEKMHGKYFPNGVFDAWSDNRDDNAFQISFTAGPPEIWSYGYQSNDPFFNRFYSYESYDHETRVLNSDIGFKMFEGNSVHTLNRDKVIHLDWVKDYRNSPEKVLSDLDQYMKKGLKALNKLGVDIPKK